MRVSSWDQFLAAVPPPQGAAMTIGGFDGIHRGHRALLEKVLERKDAYEPTVITFLKSPKAVLRPENYPGDICTLSQKLEILQTLGIAHTVLIDFSRNFSTINGKDFIEFLAGRGKLRRLVVGGNFRCGHRLDTGIEQIRELLFPRAIPVEVLDPLMDGSKPVSSSRIRTALAAGDLELASKLLGRPFELDLAGLDAKEEGTVKSYVPPERVMLPPGGLYRGLVKTPDGIREEISAEIRIHSGRILIPGPLNAGRVKFLTRLGEARHERADQGSK